MLYICFIHVLYMFYICLGKILFPGKFPKKPSWNPDFTNNLFEKNDDIATHSINLNNAYIKLFANIFLFKAPKNKKSISCIFADMIKSGKIEETLYMNDDTSSEDDDISDDTHSDTYDTSEEEEDDNNASNQQVCF